MISSISLLRSHAPRMINLFPVRRSACKPLLPGISPGVSASLVRSISVLAPLPRRSYPLQPVIRFSTPHEMPSQLRMKIKAVHRTAASATLKSAGVVRLHLGGFPPRLFNVDELPKRTAVCCVTQVKSTSSKVRIPTRAIPSLHILGRGFDARHIDLRYGTGHSS